MQISGASLAKIIRRRAQLSRESNEATDEQFLQTGTENPRHDPEFRVKALERRAAELEMEPLKLWTVEVEGFSAEDMTLMTGDDLLSNPKPNLQFEV